MTLRRGVWGAIVLLGVVALAWGLLGRGPGARTNRRGAARSSGAMEGVAAASADRSRGDPRTGDATPAALAIGALERAIGFSDALAAQAAAMALRALLRSDAGARVEAERVLLDAAAASDLRQALALVLGTLPGGASDGALLDALARFAEDAALVRCLVLGLGAMREPPEDDEIFGLGDDPWGAVGPAGIGITVRRKIEDARVRAALAGRLGAEAQVVREAAAVSLRHSLEQADARSAFVATLAAEPADEVATVLGEALAQWAGGTGDVVERDVVVERLLARAADPDLAGFRLRIEDDFRRVVVGPAQRATLLALTDAGRDDGVRGFALAILAGSAPRSGRQAVDEARSRIVEVLDSDESVGLRDRAARLMGGLPPDGAAIAALRRAAREDPAWNVRWQALGALANVASGKDLRESLERAASDPDPRVQERARELLARAR